ncbi:DNA-directed RNA polymerase III subunit rpc9 [Phlyctema vagabunda]|uniref:DNA-directed RNA polymerase III subunit RPC9 n=1 Tax=Phlyctema vagabunda TaxID=108571 RepID=A0ABR4PXS1_9HELO
MKILEAQAAILTNYEVYRHIIDEKKDHEKLRDQVKKRVRKDWEQKNRKISRTKKEKETEIDQIWKPITKRPGNLETIVRELKQYLEEAPSPLAEKVCPYNENTVKNLLERLRPYDLTKAEVLMIMNLRPTNVINLNTVVEEAEMRFPTEEMQQEMVDAIAEVLGKADTEANRQAMTDSKEATREQAVADADMVVEGA